MTRACAHHWIIDTAVGPTSRGVCSDCGAVREFANSPPDDPEERRRIRLGIGQTKGRGAELAPLRKRFAELVREGLTMEDIKVKAGFRDVAPSTLKTWWARHKKQNRPAPCADAPVDAVAADVINAPLEPPAPQPMPPVLAALLELMPGPDANRQRHSDWLDAWDAVYTLLYLGGR